MSRSVDLTGSAVGLARTLRAAGVDASADRVHAFLAALDILGADRRTDVYWAGRLTLCADPDDIARYDRVFDAFFAGLRVARRPRPVMALQVEPMVTPSPPAARAEDGPTDPAAVVSRNASDAERLRHRDVTTLNDRERRELHRLLAAFSLPGDHRRTRRHRPDRTGTIDRRRTVRSLLAAGGEPGVLRWRDHQVRPRRVVLLVDVSGSMAGYADALLRFAHAAARRRLGSTEVFSLGTRLTRLTTEMAHRDPDTAMQAVSAAIPDWSGGTRLGPTLKRFLDQWGQRGTARGAVVVVLSDGWETGDVDVLAEQMRRLGRLAHRVVWANPRAGSAGFEPTARGMAAALPHCDDLVEGHSLAALEQLAAVVNGAARRQRPSSHRTVV